MSEGKIKPCSCGNKYPEIDETAVGPIDDLVSMYRVLCSRVGCGMNSGWKTSEEKAVKTWNHRDSHDQLVEALKGLVKAVAEHKANGYPCSIPTLRAEITLKAAGEKV